MRFVCATHGHCFDGLASTVLFRRLLERVHPDAQFEVLSCGYGTMQVRPTPEVLSGDGNAILDFRYFPIDSLTFYFDHHRTAFQSEEDRQHFERRAAREPHRFIVNVDCTSCTKLIARLAESEYGVDLQDLGQLVAWADKIDSADFDSAKEATDREEPIMRLVTVVEQYGDSKFLHEATRMMSDLGLEKFARHSFVENKYNSIAPRQRDFVEQVRRKGQLRGRVAYVDLLDVPVQSVTKFTQYEQFPDATYSVMLATMASGIRISVGYNPWCGHPLDVDVSRICARYGGGGHQVVGGVALAKNQRERARVIAEEIVQELQSARIERSDQ